MTTAAQRDTTTVTDRAVPKIAERAAGETAMGQVGHVACHTGELNGLDVATARIKVTSLAPAMGVSEERRPAMTGRRPRRLWSRRRVPTAGPTVVVTAVCGALALGLIMQRSAVLWRSGAARWLWQHGPGDPSV
ncbi:MAG: Asp23/Gls24 family envelope stress response protein, partial [Streptomyces sp.]|nr:Asp23/Gls24 family envelope stress response protein [Streptomyces sp.]